MHTDACILMHAGEYWRVRYVDDVFLEPHLHILLCWFSYTDCVHFVHILCIAYSSYAEIIQLQNWIYTTRIRFVCHWHKLMQTNDC